VGALQIRLDYSDLELRFYLFFENQPNKFTISF